MSDTLGQAIHDHYHKRLKGPLYIYNTYGAREQMPVKTYFRDKSGMPDIEWLAIETCSGTVLDIGAGAGSHALLLQQQGKKVLALDNSPLAVTVMQQRGVLNTANADIFAYADKKFDTLLLLMNGIGLAGTISHLEMLLQHFKILLSAKGQILFDSSDVAYLYGDGKLPPGRYYGEIRYRYGYNKKKSDWFTWLYIDEGTMQLIAAKCGYNMDVLLEDESGQYLARLTLS